MTPERLKELRDWMERSKTATNFGLERADLAALLDHIEAQEKALQAADKMREDFESEHYSEYMGSNGWICKNRDSACKVMLAYDEARAEVKR